MHVQGDQVSLLEEPRGLWRDDAERIFEVAEGRPLGSFERNPWPSSSSWRYEPTQPISLRIDLNDPFDLVDSERMVLMWDRAVIARGPLAVREGESYVITIPELKGNVLELFLTDSAVTPTVHVAPLHLADELAADIANEKKKAEEAPGFFDRLFDAQKAGVFGISVVAVVLIVGAVIAAPSIAKIVTGR